MASLAASASSLVLLMAMMAAFSALHRALRPEDFSFSSASSASMRASRSWDIGSVSRATELTFPRGSASGSRRSCVSAA